MRERTESFESAGTTVRIDAYEPDGGGVGPAVIALHGSNGMTNGAALVRGFTIPIVAMGYSVYLPHYFERTGTVRSDPETSRRHFLTWLQTVADAVSYVGIQPRVDRGRVGIVGVSLGAYLGLVLSSQDPRVKAMVDLFGALPEPFASRTTALPPTLVLHGEADTIVPVAEAHRLVAKLKAIGTPFDVRIYPNEGHVLSPVAGFDAARRIVAFLNEHIAP